MMTCTASRKSFTRLSAGLQLEDGGYLQARVGSARLPGKVLLPPGGITVLEGATPGHRHSLRPSWPITSPVLFASRPHDGSSSLSESTLARILRKSHHLLAGTASCWLSPFQQYFGRF